MAQALFDALNGVGVDSQTALALQFLLGSQPGAPTSLLTNGHVTEDEDLFQCGKCKEQFSSFSEFFSHKKTHNSERLETVSSKGDETSGLMYSEIVPVQEFAQPITLSDSEFLSLGMDQGSHLNIASTSQVLDGCDSYLSNADQEQTTFQVPAAISQEVAMSVSAEGTKDEKKKEMIGTNTITVSVVGAVQDQISANDKNEELSKEVDTSPGKIKCVYCGKSFTKNFDLQQHVRSHTGERPFQCVVCGRAFSQKSNVKKHMESHKVWPRRIRTLSTDLIVNSLKPAEEENNSLNTVNDADNDQTSGGSSDNSITKSYICQYCLAMFTNYSQLKSHHKIHAHQKVYRCIQKNCNETFSDLDSFLGHTQIHENEAQYHCHVCNKEFRSLDELGTHQYNHSVPTNKSPPRIVSCKKCKSRFANLESLERHMVNDSHTYPCPQCCKVFTCERFLRRHLTTHTTVLPYVCQHCGKAFKTEQYLNIHLVTHSNEKPFSCQFCPAAFNRKDKLSRHNLIHENLRKFTCPFNKHLGCTKAFNRKDKLKAHMLTHSAKLKYSCGICGRIFQKQAHLKQHEKICIQKKLKGALSLSSKSAKSGKMDNIDSSKNVIEVQSDMSTIEIVVVPVTSEQASNENTGSFRVTFPAAKAADPLDLSQTVLTSDQEVPVYNPLLNATTDS